MPLGVELATCKASVKISRVMNQSQSIKRLLKLYNLYKLLHEQRWKVEGS